MLTNYSSQIESYFVSILSYFNLSQFNCIHNYDNVKLDLVLSNAHVITTVDPNPSLHIDKRHPPLNKMLSCNEIYILPVNIRIYNFENCDNVNIIKCISY